MLTPTMHRPIPMNARVVVPSSYLPNSPTGTVVGISHMHVMFTYMVLLDTTIETEHGPHFGDLCVRVRTTRRKRRVLGDLIA
jgi:hypothetical protein